MRIIIVGAGLGGLTAALCFARNGHEVQVLEQRPDPTPVGGGINIRPGATRLLQSWGLTAGLDQVCDITGANALRSLKTGKIATRTIATDVSDAKDLGTNRDILLSLLHEKAREAGATLLFNTTVTKVTESAQEAQVSLGNGTILRADLILATDGVKSSIRKQVLQGCPGPIEPDVSDVTLYGIRLTRDQMIREPVLAPLMDNSYINVYMGENGIVHVTSRYNHKLSTYQALFCIKGDTDQKGLWDEEGDIEYVRGFFRDSCDEIVRVLEIADACDRWKLAELPDLPRWTSEEGRILLLGDSAVSYQTRVADRWHLD
jgi:salicylate hydroxylase